MQKLILFLICLLMLGCSSSSPQGDKPKILVTLPPYATFVKSLVGTHATVEIFVPPGANPHSYEPSPRQIKHFTEAKVWFTIGDPIENKMAQFLGEKDVQIVNITDKLSTLEETHEEKDLHVWTNPLLAKKQVDEMASVLSHLCPELSALVLENSQKLQARLEQTDSEIKTSIGPLRGHSLAVSHPSLGYFCERYELQQLSVEIEGKDPLPQDIAQLVNELQRNSVPVILTEPEFNNKGAILIAKKMNLPTEEIDTLSEDYFGMLNRLTKIIVKYYDHPN